ncbi:uncharacterized protein LOC105663591 isoform X1 [Megachile rotundata]|uniref:uncharacterized protein LOC105663591 isoform X1 n=1 Tax=Megachile rotundata TaxID=143995 RepID=UPI003FD06FCC
MIKRKFQSSNEKKSHGLDEKEDKKENEDFQLVVRKRKRGDVICTKSTDSNSSPSEMNKQPQKRRPSMLNRGEQEPLNLGDTTNRVGETLNLKQIEQQNRQDSNFDNLQGGFIKVKCKEGLDFQQTLREIKGKIIIGNVRVNWIRQTRWGKEVLFYLEKSDELHSLGDRIRGAGNDMDVIVGKRKKVMFTGIDLDVQEDEFKEILHTEHKFMDCRVIFYKRSLKGNNSACVDFPIDTANEVIKRERLRIGWTSCRTAEYVDNRKCFKCGSKTHLAWSCKLEKGVCYSCGGGDHTSRECTFLRHKTGGTTGTNTPKNHEISPITMEIERLKKLLQEKYNEVTGKQDIRGTTQNKETNTWGQPEGISEEERKVVNITYRTGKKEVRSIGTQTENELTVVKEKWSDILKRGTNNLDIRTEKDRPRTGLGDLRPIPNWQVKKTGIKNSRNILELNVGDAEDMAIIRTTVINNQGRERIIPPSPLRSEDLQTTGRIQSERMRTHQGVWRC